MTADPNAAARQVATSTAPVSIPASPSTSGFTKMMYDSVRKVVHPASTSVRTDVPRSSRRK